MKRYLLFGGDSYYPGGGWDDFAGSFNTVSEAQEAAKKFRPTQWFHIIDTHTMEEVAL